MPSAAESDQDNHKVGRTLYGSRPYRLVQRRQQEPDHGGIDPAKGGPYAAPCPQPFGEGQRRREKQISGQEDEDERHDAIKCTKQPAPARRRRSPRR